MSSGGVCHETRQVFGHMAARREHERMDDHLGRSLGDATRKALGDRGLCKLHVSRLHDARRTESLLDQGSDLSEQCVGRGASAPVVDQEHRSALARRLLVRAGEIHRAYLGHALLGVKKRSRRVDLKRSLTERV